MTGCGLHRDESVPEAGGAGRKSEEKKALFNAKNKIKLCKK